MVFEDERLSYGELDARSSQYCHVAHGMPTYLHAAVAVTPLAMIAQISSIQSRSERAPRLRRLTCPVSKPMDEARNEAAKIAALAQFFRDLLGAVAVGIMEFMQTGGWAFLGGSVMQLLVGGVWRAHVSQPVISVRLEEAGGCAYETKLTDGAISRGIRLRVENTGWSTMKDCTGFITDIQKLPRSEDNTPPIEEVIQLGWAHDGRTRAIPPGTRPAHA